jgi:hypothetical protein
VVPACVVVLKLIGEGEIETVKMTATAREGDDDDGKTLLVLIK